MSDTLPHENENRANEDTVRKDFWPKLKANLARLPFAEDLVAARYAAFDSRTPLKVRGTLFGALAYFILPIDVVPDFILGLGFTSLRNTATRPATPWPACGPAASPAPPTDTVLPVSKPLDTQPWPG